MNIERGENVDASKRVLRAILRDNAGYHFVQSPEEERSEELQFMRDMPEFTVQDKLNLDAVSTLLYVTTKMARCTAHHLVNGLFTSEVKEKL